VETSDLTAAGCLWPVIRPLGGGLSGLAAQFSDDSALEVCIHVMRYTNRRIYFVLLLNLLFYHSQTKLSSDVSIILANINEQLHILTFKFRKVV